MARAVCRLLQLLVLLALVAGGAPTPPPSGSGDGAAPGLQDTLAQLQAAVAEWRHHAAQAEARVQRIEALAAVLSAGGVSAANAAEQSVDALAVDAAGGVAAAAVSGSTIGVAMLTPMPAPTDAPLAARSSPSRFLGVSQLEDVTHAAAREAAAPALPLLSSSSNAVANDSAASVAMLAAGYLVLPGEPVRECTVQEPRNGVSESAPVTRCSSVVPRLLLAVDESGTLKGWKSRAGNGDPSSGYAHPLQLSYVAETVSSRLTGPVTAAHLPRSLGSHATRYERSPLLVLAGHANDTTADTSIVALFNVTVTKADTQEVVLGPRGVVGTKVAPPPPSSSSSLSQSRSTGAEYEVSVGLRCEAQLGTTPGKPASSASVTALVMPPLWGGTGLRLPNRGALPRQPRGSADATDIVLAGTAGGDVIVLQAATCAQLQVVDAAAATGGGGVLALATAGHHVAVATAGGGAVALLRRIALAPDTNASSSPSTLYQTLPSDSWCRLPSSAAGGSGSLSITALEFDLNNSGRLWAATASGWIYAFHVAAMVAPSVEPNATSAACELLTAVPPLLSPSSPPATTAIATALVSTPHYLLVAQSSGALAVFNTSKADAARVAAAAPPRPALLLQLPRDAASRRSPVLWPRPVLAVAGADPQGLLALTSSDNGPQQKPNKRGKERVTSPDRLVALFFVPASAPPQELALRLPLPPADHWVSDLVSTMRAPVIIVAILVFLWVQIQSKRAARGDSVTFLFSWCCGGGEGSGGRRRGTSRGARRGGAFDQDEDFDAQDNDDEDDVLGGRSATSFAAAAFRKAAAARSNGSSSGGGGAASVSALLGAYDVSAGSIGSKRGQRQAAAEAPDPAPAAPSDRGFLHRAAMEALASARGEQDYEALIDAMVAEAQEETLGDGADFAGPAAAAAAVLRKRKAFEDGSSSDGEGSDGGAGAGARVPPGKRRFAGPNRRTSALLAAQRGRAAAGSGSETDDDEEDEEEELRRMAARAAYGDEEEEEDATMVIPSRDALMRQAAAAAGGPTFVPDDVVAARARSRFGGGGGGASATPAARAARPAAVPSSSGTSAAYSNSNAAETEWDDAGWPVELPPADATSAPSLHASAEELDRAMRRLRARAFNRRSPTSMLDATDHFSADDAPGQAGSSTEGAARALASILGIGHAPAFGGTRSSGGAGGRVRAAPQTASGRMAVMAASSAAAAMAGVREGYDSDGTSGGDD